MHHRILTVCALGALIVLAACGDGDNDGADGDVQTVTSDDGLVTIEIPEGALPDGLEASDITVTALPVDEFEVEGEPEDGTRVVAAIDLQPSGTVFQRPVTIRTRMPATAEPGLALLVSEDGDVEPLELAFESDGDDVITSAEVGHFSDLVHMGGIDAIEFEFLTPIENHMVGETFTVRTRVSRVDFEEEFNQVILGGEPYSRYRFRPSDDPAWEVNVDVTVFGAAEGKVRFEQAAEPEQNALIIELEVTCQRAGKYEANVGGYAKVGVRVIPIDPPGEARDLRSDSSYGDFLEREALCVADETPTPSPTPQPTASPVAAIPGAFGDLMDAVANGEISTSGALATDQLTWSTTFLEQWSEIPAGPTVSSFPVDQVAPKAPSRPETGFESAGAGLWNVSDDGRERLFFNTVFPCGEGEFAFTLCPDPLGSSPGGDHMVVITQLQGPLPVPVAEPDAQYQYGFVYDADGSAAGNYQANPSFPNDFFDGTDRWYTANYAPGTGWTMSVTQVSGGVPTAVPSAARIIILDNVMALVVPASEFGTAEPAYRVTAFWHTGDFGRNPPNVWSGDVFPAVADGLSTNYLATPLAIPE